MRGRYPCAGSSSIRRSIVEPSLRARPLTFAVLPASSFLALAAEISAPMKVLGSLNEQVPHDFQAGVPSGPVMRSRRTFSQRYGERGLPLSSTRPPHWGQRPICSPVGAASRRGAVMPAATTSWTSLVTPCMNASESAPSRSTAARSRSIEAVSLTSFRRGSTASMRDRPSAVEMSVVRLRSR